MLKPFSEMKYKAAQRAAELIVDLFMKDFQGNLKKIMHLVDALAFHPEAKGSANKIRMYYETNHPLYQLMQRMAEELNFNSRKALINLLLSAWFLNKQKRQKFKDEEGFYPPQLLVVSPTERCNLDCKGCWAGMYKCEQDMELELLKRIIEEAKEEMGIEFFVISGGEPFLRDDLFQIYERFSNVFFMVYTNGTLITDEVAARLGQFGNVAPMISIEGFQEQTDSRRGKGVYAKIMASMDRLKTQGVLFGFSATTFRNNVDVVSSEEFVDLMIAKGCFWGWYFQYIPIGRNPDPNLMLTPQQREKLRKRTYQNRSKKTIFLADFWNDGPQVGGCLAGGRYYLHINCQGDVEPCVFCHFAADNIKQKSLREILKSPFMREIRKNIPYDGNTLRACMLIDRPWVFREYWTRFKPYPTHKDAELFTTALSKDLDRYAGGVAEIFDKAWNEGDYEKIAP